MATMSLPSYVLVLGRTNETAFVVARMGAPVANAIDGVVRVTRSRHYQRIYLRAKDPVTLSRAVTAARLGRACTIEAYRGGYVATLTPESLPLGEWEILTRAIDRVAPSTRIHLAVNGPGVNWIIPTTELGKGW